MTAVDMFDPSMSIEENCERMNDYSRLEQLTPKTLKHYIKCAKGIDIAVKQYPWLKRFEFNDKRQTSLAIEDVRSGKVMKFKTVMSSISSLFGVGISCGCVNISGVVKVRTTKSFGESTVSKIIRLVEDAGEHKSKSETFITRFARVYTPVVVLAAIALALLPPLFSGHFATAFPVWLYRALLFLVVSCPCAFG